MLTGPVQSIIVSDVWTLEPINTIRRIAWCNHAMFSKYALMTVLYEAILFMVLVLNVAAATDLHADRKGVILLVFKIWLVF